MGQLDELLSRDSASRAMAGRDVSGGKSAGLGFGPLEIIQDAADTVGGFFDAASMGKFDYGQADYTAKDAGQFASQKAKAAVGGIPLVGGMLGGIFGLIGQKIAEKRAAPILENRDEKMNNLISYQKEKLRENRFFREQDLNTSQDGYL